MTFRVSTTLVLCSLLLIGGWGVWKIFVNSQSNKEPNGGFTAYTTGALPNIESTPPINSKSRSVNLPQPITRSYALDFERIKELLIADQFEDAVDQANSLYSSLNGSQAIFLKDTFISHAKQLQESNQTRKSLSLLKSFNQYFNDIEAWELMGQLGVIRNETCRIN